MGPKIAAAVAAFVRGEPMNVTRRSGELGISAKTFYKYVGRFGSVGVDGFYPDPRRPLTSPTRLPVELEDVLVRIRKEEAEAGWDYGAEAVLMRLEERRHLWPARRRLPARSTVNRVFDARGQLDKVPNRKPRRKPRRFQRDRVNELWQFDGFEYVLADGTKAVVLHLTDDCSRTDLALQAARSENGLDVWQTFCCAVGRYGLPAAVLNDNAGAFSGRRRGWTAKFEQRLADLGVRAIAARRCHPQTCGKNERAHQRVQKWLARRPRAKNPAELQQLLDNYREQFNDRRNRVLGKLTPHQRFDLGPLASPDNALEPVTHITRHTVSTTGSIGLNGALIGLGRRHVGKPAICFRNGDHVTVFVEDTFARELTLDQSRHYQPQHE
ncbi:MAG: DDE-type integrase/transposase/recombinase [Actinomycetota bacterium]|nr:DDE-type integrase/transposase/recombinase [Actinomycetota bacterium]